MNVGNYPCKAPSPGRGGVARGGWSTPSCELELVFSENQQRRPNPRVLAAGWRGGCHYGVISGLRAEDSGHSDNNGPESIVIVLRGSDSA